MQDEHSRLDIVRSMAHRRVDGVVLVAVRSEGGNIDYSGPTPSSSPAPPSWSSAPPPPRPADRFAVTAVDE